MMQIPFAEDVSPTPLSEVRGRLAPSPTGLLHLGNAWAFLMAWFLCRSRQGSLVLRMEDIDPARSSSAYVQKQIEDLRWLGLDWDEGPDERDIAGERGPYAPYTQSARHHLYTEALKRLEHDGHLYPCFCTRKELRLLAGAPHVGDEGAPYPGTCRFLTPEERLARSAGGRAASLRFACPDERIPFTDIIRGPCSMDLKACGGDFALRRSDGVIAYQLAVVVDDALMRIRQVVRGRDILASTPRQLALFRALGYPPPVYAHIPLVCDVAGERLAKRHQSLGLAALREEGVDPRAVVGYLGWKSGLVPDARLVHPKELLRYVPDSFPSWWRTRDIVLDAEPVALLRSFGVR